MAPYPQGGNFSTSRSVCFTVYLLVPQKRFPFILGEKPRFLVGEGPALAGLDAGGNVFLWAEVALGHPVIVLIRREGVEGAGQKARPTSHTGFPIVHDPAFPFSMAQASADTSLDAGSGNALLAFPHPGGPTGERHHHPLKRLSVSGNLHDLRDPKGIDLASQNTGLAQHAAFWMKEYSLMHAFIGARASAAFPR